MNFAAIAIGAGIAGALLVAYLQGPPLPVAAELTNTTVIDPTTTAAIARPKTPSAGNAAIGDANATRERPAAFRLIDLRSGATCKITNPGPLDRAFASMLIGPDCAGSRELSQVTKWRSDEDGSLEMADSEGRTVLRFMPGDGVLYESIYPANAMVTIVPARG